MLLDDYFNSMGQILNTIEDTQKDTIQRVAAVAAESIAKGGVLHIFGSGHSHMVAEDAFNSINAVPIELDNYGVHGDAHLQHVRLAQKIGPSFTIAGILIIQALAAAIVERLLELGFEPPIYQSANLAGGEERNGSLADRYKERIRYL